MELAPPRVTWAFTVKLRVFVQPVEVFVKVRVTVPALTPVTRPASETVAMALLLLAQVPPEAGVTLAVCPGQTTEAPPSVGRAVTEKLVVLMHPVVVLVKVRVTEPAATPETTPALVTEAMALLLLAQVPPVAGVTLAVAPTQTEVAPPSEGPATTVALTVFVQPVVVLVNVRVADPAATPVTTPAFVTVATPGVPLDHVPPVSGVTFAVPPAQRLRDVAGAVALRILAGMTCLAIEGPW